MTMTQWLVDPWSVYGDVRSDLTKRGALRVAVADIGVLPPAGRYVGEAAVDGGERVPAAFTVPPRSEAVDHERWIRIEPAWPLSSAGSRVMVRFTGFEPD